MYCKNCGNLMANDAAVCVRCGCAKGTGRSYCPNCGQATDPNAAACPHCGAGLTAAANPNAKSKIAAGLFGILLGSFGVHNFYLGYKGKAWAQLLITLLSCGTLSVVSAVWGLIEGIMILAGNTAVDANGQPLKD